MGSRFNTYFKRGDKKTTRISLELAVLSQNENHAALFAKIRINAASLEEAQEFRALNEAKSQWILKIPRGKTVLGQ
jgi:formylmethanofuran dehydrogenase subunit E